MEPFFQTLTIFWASSVNILKIWEALNSLPDIKQKVDSIYGSKDNHFSLPSDRLSNIIISQIEEALKENKILKKNNKDKFFEELKTGLVSTISHFDMNTRQNQVILLNRIHDINEHLHYIGVNMDKICKALSIQQASPEKEDDYMKMWDNFDFGN